MSGVSRSRRIIGILLATAACGSASIAAESILQLETRDGLIYAAGEDVPFSGLNEGHYANGNRWFRIPIKNGMPDGKAEFWYENGNKKSEILYVKGVIVGIQRKWSEDGRLVEEIDHESKRN